MSDENRIILSGEITTDLKITQSKDKSFKYVGFQLKSQKKVITKKEQTHNFVWINAYQEQADFCIDYLSKGQSVEIEGTLDTEIYNDKSGKRQYKWYVRAEKIERKKANNTSNAWVSTAVDTGSLETAAYVSENPNA